MAFDHKIEMISEAEGHISFESRGGVLSGGSSGVPPRRSGEATGER
ncbi:hypothetical protein COLSTE_01193 [Collinsella stercoris DSM 13279]|uniref:Uncharacterized protein n=1 Tax=Collinsella stercoris DSM 13279 TaxID=445975 RepID=B6GAU3_9ACTN|nr:hypothetical protein COLSTE_01193 [Collinsella stercoris DSM 13279]